MKKNILIIVLLSFTSLMKAQTTYYVSNTGFDDNTGLSRSSAWKTIEKINTMILQPGDSVLFEAEGIWRDILSVSQGAAGDGNRIYYGRYGEGVNPQILGSEIASDWTETAVTNVWKSATVLNHPRYGGWGYPGNVYFIIDDSTSWGVYHEYSDLSELTAELDWTWNDNTIYIYTTDNPNEKYNRVETAQRDVCTRATNSESSYIEVNGIDMFYSKRSGYNNGYPEVYGQTDVTIRNCHIGYIGVKGGAAAYGIEAFHSNFLVENCVITDCGRRGISFNFYTQRPDGEEIHVENIIVRNNLFKRGQHTTSLDMANDNTESGNTINNVYFYNNIVDDSEIEWLPEDRTSNQLYFQPSGISLNNVYVYNNVFIKATARNILVSRADTIHIWYNTIIGHNPNIDTSPYGNVSIAKDAKIDYQNNILYANLPDNSLYNYGLLNDYASVEYIERDYNLYWQEVYNPSRRGFTGSSAYGYWDIKEWDTYQNNLSPWDANSPSPQNPWFSDYENYDFSLSDSSSAIGTANPIAMVVTDILGFRRDLNHPSIGAYEYRVPASTDVNQPNQITGKNNVIVYPNPANNFLNIENIPLNTTVYIYNLMGNLVLNSNITNRSGQINISSLNPGVYILRINNSKIDENFSFMKN